MRTSAERFPAFEAWQGMSESEQDALLEKIERAERRSMRWRWMLGGLIGVTICAGLAVVFT